MIITAAAISLSLNLGSLLQRPAAAPRPTCNIKTVSYKFVGPAGTSFRYDGETFRIPDSGWIELIASGRDRAQIDGREVPLDAWPIDKFSTRTVQLSNNAPTAQQQ